VAKDDISGVWRTIGGRRVFIKDGQDLASAMKESGKFKKGRKLTNDEKSDLEHQNFEEFKKRVEEYNRKKESEKTKTQDLQEKANREKADYLKMDDQELRDELEHNRRMLGEMERRLNGSYKISEEEQEELERRAAHYESTKDDIRDELRRRKGIDPVERDYAHGKEQLIDDFVKNNPKWEDGIYDEEEADRMFEANGSRTWEVVYDRLYEKAHPGKTKTEIKKDIDYIPAQERLAKEKISSEEYNKRLDNEYNNLKNGKINTKEYFKRTDDIMDNYTTDRIEKGQAKAREKTNDIMNKDIRTKAKTNFGKEQVMEYLKNNPTEIHEIEEGYDYMVANRIAQEYKIGKRKAQNIINKVTIEDVENMRKEGTKERIKAEQKSINDAIRRKAYQKYLKEHPNSKMKFEDFIK